MHIMQYILFKLSVLYIESYIENIHFIQCEGFLFDPADRLVPIYLPFCVDFQRATL